MLYASKLIQGQLLLQVASTSQMVGPWGLTQEYVGGLGSKQGGSPVCACRTIGTGTALMKGTESDLGMPNPRDRRG